MKSLSDLPVEVIAGGPIDAINCNPLPPFSADTIDFLGALSTELLGRQDVRVWPDVVTFAYWCRPSNLKRLHEAADRRYPRLGRGLVFHIAPSNVPVNFAYSLAFAMLAGNANIVRVPSAQYPQVEIIVKSIDRLFESSKFRRIGDMNRLVRYPRDKEINRALSSVCHARMIWGGDATIADLRAIPTSPRCVDVNFPDRYSLCVLGAESILQLDPTGLAELARNFYNDAFLLDQNACSSPHLLTWVGDDAMAHAAMARFWPAVGRVVMDRKPESEAHSVERFTHLCATVLRTSGCLNADWRGGMFARLLVDELPPDIADLRGNHGFFIEFVTEQLDVLAPIVTERYQTLTFAGVSGGELRDWVRREGLMGIDRVVPVGKALDMGPIWDGSDLIASISRIIADI